jgi:hypothetical protein
MRALDLSTKLGSSDMQYTEHLLQKTQHFDRCAQIIEGKAYLAGLLELLRSEHFLHTFYRARLFVFSVIAERRNLLQLLFCLLRAIVIEDTSAFCRTARVRPVSYSPVQQARRSTRTLR